MSKKNMAIESGNYYDSKGEVANILDVGGEPPNDHPMTRMAVRSGDFFASDGSVHNLDELSGGGSGGTDAYIEAKDRGYTGTKDEFYTELGQVRDKVDKIEGMGLSSNDFTDRDKEVLSAFVGSRVRVVGEPGGTVNLDTLKVRAINNYQPELILAIGTLEGSDFTMSSMSSLTAISITRNTGFEIDDTIQFFNYQDANHIMAARRDSRNGQWTTSITGPFVDEAPLDNEEYVRKNGNWTRNSGGGSSEGQWDQPDEHTLATNKQVKFLSEDPLDPEDPTVFAEGYIQQRTDALVIQPDWGTEGVKIAGRPLILMDGATLGSDETYKVPNAYLEALSMFGEMHTRDILPFVDPESEEKDAVRVGNQQYPYFAGFFENIYLANDPDRPPRSIVDIFEPKSEEGKQWNEPDENTLNTNKTVEVKELIAEGNVMSKDANIQEQLAVGGEIILKGQPLSSVPENLMNVINRVGDVETMIPNKADLVNGKVPEYQLPASTGDGLWVDETENIAASKNVKIETVNPTGTILQLVGGTDKEYLKIIRDNSETTFDTSFGVIVFKPGVEMGGSLKVKGDVFPNGKSTGASNGLDYRVNALEKSILNKRAVLTFKATEDVITSCIWTMERSWNLPDGIQVSAPISNQIQLTSNYSNNIYADITFNGMLSIRKDGSFDPNDDDWLMYRVFVEDLSFGEVRSDSREVFRGVPCLKNFPITGAGTLFGGSSQTWHIGMEKDGEGSVIPGSEPEVVSGNITMEITFRDS